MPEETDFEKLIRESLEKLPENIQTAILDDSFDTKIRTVGMKNNLHIDKFQILGDLTRIMMLGLSDPETFPKQIAASVEISDDAALKVANDINTDVMVPIQNMMKEAPAETPMPAPAPAAVSSQTPKVPSLNLGGADSLLSETSATVSTPKEVTKPAEQPAPKPDLSKIDPYREPAL